MSEISDLIKVTKNIEKQNEEIIRLLKKIAGEDEEDKFEKYKSMLDSSIDFGELYIDSGKIAEKKEEQSEDEELDTSMRIGTLLENDIGVGEVYFIEGSDIFKLSVKNNETSINNLTGDGEPSGFALQELVANESIKNNQSLEDSTVILSNEQSQNLPETMKICVEQGAGKVYMPLFASAQLVAAPQNLMNMIKFDFYKNNEHLIEKLFKGD